MARFEGANRRAKNDSARRWTIDRRLRFAGVTSLCEVDAENGKITEMLQLAPAGDTSYPGLVFYDGLLWMSYHWGPGITSAKVYLAKVRLP